MMVPLCLVWLKKRKTLLVLAGTLYAIFGVLAFFNIPGGHDQHHHTLAHNLTHIILGLLLLWVALRTSPSVRQAVCFAFTSVYLLIGLSGFFVPKTLTIQIVPGLVEFHAGDYGVHLATALFFLVLGLLKPAPKIEAHPVGARGPGKRPHRQYRYS